MRPLARRTAAIVTLLCALAIISTSVEARKKKAPPVRKTPASVPAPIQTSSGPPTPPVEHIAPPLEPHPAESPVDSYGLLPSGATPAPAPSPKATLAMPTLDSTSSAMALPTVGSSRSALTLPTGGSSLSAVALPTGGASLSAVALPTGGASLSAVAVPAGGASLSAVAVAGPSPAPALAGPTASTTHTDPLLGLTYALPAGWTIAPPTPPMNLVLLAPPSPPFRANVTILLDVNPAPLAAYAKGLGITASPTQTATLAGKPALFVGGAPEHPRLALRNAQALVDCGPYKLIFTATALADKFDAFQNDFRRLLDGIALQGRAPMEVGPGTPYRDPDGRFALTLPPRFAREAAVGAENVRFGGPVETGRQLVGLVQMLERPKDWEASPLRLSVMRRGIPGGMTGQMLLGGNVLKRPGQPDALLMTFRYRPGDTEINEVVLEVPSGSGLLKFTFRGPGDQWALYAPALTASLRTLVAPAR